MWKASGLCDRSCEGLNVFAAAASRREAGCCLHGLLPEEVGHGSDPFFCFLCEAMTTS